GVIARDADVGDHHALLRRSRPPFWPPALGWAAQQSGTGEHDHEIRGAECHHRPGDTDAIHEVDVEIAGEKCTAAESHDRHAGGHAASIGEPLHECADRRDVAEAAPDAADDAHAEEDENRLRLQETEPTDEETSAEEQRSSRRGDAWTTALDPRTAEGGTQPEKDERSRERRVRRAEPPRRIREELLDGAVERAPC